MKRAYKRIWILKRLKTLGASDDLIIDAYVKQIRSVLELAVPVWRSSLTLKDKMTIEIFQDQLCK